MSSEPFAQKSCKENSQFDRKQIIYFHNVCYKSYISWIKSLIEIINYWTMQFYTIVAT